MRFSSSDRVGGNRGRSVRNNTARIKQPVAVSARGIRIGYTLSKCTSENASGRKLEISRNIVPITRPLGPNQPALHFVKVLITKGYALPTNTSLKAVAFAYSSHIPAVVSVIATMILSLGPCLSVSQALNGNSRKKASSL